MSAVKPLSVTIFIIMLVLWFVQVVVPFLFWVRLGVNALLALVVAGFFGVLVTNRKHMGQSLSLALIFAVVYGFVFVGIMIIFGGARNLLAANLTLILWNALFAGGPLLLQEFMRHKLLRAAHRTNKDSVAMLLTLAFTFARLPMIGPGTNWPEFVFSMVLFSLLLNILLTTIALNGSYAAQLLVGAAYGLSILLLPVLPNITPLAFSVVACVLMYINWHVYMVVNNETEAWQLARMKRLARARGGFPLMSVVTIFAAGLIAAFMLGAFRYYPLAVLTDSMSGTFERGAMVIVERINPAELAEGDIGRGDVIHFNRGGIRITHRIVEYRFDEAGRRIFITQGDANPAADAHPVTPDDVLGVVRLVLPNFGFPAVWLRQVVWD